MAWFYKLTTSGSETELSTCYVSAFMLANKVDVKQSQELPGIVFSRLPEQCLCKKVMFDKDLKEVKE